jgi:hypothetical protein
MAQKKSGWVTFSWIVFMMIGLVNLLYGMAALGRKEYFPEAGALYGSLQAHGWVWLVLGAMQLIVAVLIMKRSQIGLFAGMTLAVLGSVVWFFYMLYVPTSGFALVLLYALSLFGLAAHMEEFAID